MRRPTPRLFALAALAAGVVACSAQPSGADEHADADSGVGDAAPDVVEPDVDAATEDAGADPASDVAPEEPPHVGHVTLRRLNRTEYNHTVRDLFGTTLTPADSFPADDVSAGFDTIGSVLSVSPLHIESYAAAAQAVVGEVIERHAIPPDAQRFPGAGAASTGEWDFDDGDTRVLASNADIAWEVTVVDGGAYSIEITASADQAGDAFPLFELWIDGEKVTDAEITVPRGAEEIVRTPATLGAGAHTVIVRYVNDYWDEATGADRNLRVGELAVVGPLGRLSEPHPWRVRLLPCDPGPTATLDEQRACAHDAMAAFLRRAWRREVGDDELEAALALGERVIAAGDGLELAASLMMQAALLSPHFIYRVERAAGDEPALLDGYELASRLSYFLWSSTPDDALLDAAARGDLDTPEGLEVQARRMLADPRAETLVDDFAGQWLMIRAVDAVSPDPAVYPDFDDELRASMAEEMRRFFASFVFTDRSMLELLTATDTWIDERLARHYGIADFDGDGFRQVSFGDGSRGGLLRQAGLLTATSNPGRTSPVRRGKFILGQLLCDEPRPPPPGVEGLPDTAGEGLSLRDQMEVHRADPVCASCHKVMDPLGFGLENYDGVGLWRTSYGRDPVDSTGELPDGRTFAGPEELAALVAADPAFSACVVEKLMTYGLGRIVDYRDYSELHAIAARFEEGGYRLSDAIVAIVQSAPFRYRAPDDSGDE